MPLTHTDTPISNLVINRFETLAEFESAQQGGLIGQDDISMIDENIQADWNQSNTTAPDYIKNKPEIPTVNDATLTIQKNGTTVDTFTANASVDKTINITVPTSAADVSAIPTSQKGAASGVAELDSNGKVPSSQLPSYVDDVLEYANTAAFPATGESGKIYIALDTNKTYRWGGSEYVEISASLALGETSSTAYRGDRGKTAYDHSQITNGSNPHNTTLSGLTDTNISSPTDGQILVYDSNTSKWVNGNASANNSIVGNLLCLGGQPMVTVTVNAGANGSASANPTSVVYGGSSVLTATPDSGYMFDKWNDNNTTNPRTITNITSNVTYTASFKPTESISFSFDFTDSEFVEKYESNPTTIYIGCNDTTYELSPVNSSIIINTTIGEIITITCYPYLNSMYYSGYCLVPSVNPYPSTFSMTQQPSAYDWDYQSGMWEFEAEENASVSFSVQNV